MSTLRVERQGNSERVYRFIDAFQRLYGRKPQPDDAASDFAAQVARDLQMNVAGARYYLRWAILREEKESDTPSD
jgi:hypothetical protein